MSNKTKPPLVSVITPTYNREDFVVQAIESVLAQTYPHFEMIIVDDGSTDNTKSVIEPFLLDTRVSYFYQGNQRQSVARNRALAVAKGDYICFLDSDNYWLPDKLEVALVVFAQHYDVDIVYGDCITVDQDGLEISRSNMTGYSGNIAALMLRDNFVSMNTVMAKKKCFDELGGFDKRCKVADDYDLWLRFSAHYNYFYLPVMMAYYRVMPNQISSNKDRRFKSNKKIIERFHKKFPDAVTGEERNKGWSYFYTRRGRYHAQVGQLKKAGKDYLKALSYTPTFYGAWRALFKLILLRR